MSRPRQSPRTLDSRRTGGRRPRNATAWVDGICKELQIFGDSIKTKHHRHFRIGMQNFGGFLIDPDEVGEESLWNLIKNYDFDIFGIPETNLNWSKLHGKQIFYNRYKERFEKGTIRTVKAHNIHGAYIQSRGLPGGVAQIATQQGAMRISQSGRDPLLLGRWCWQRLLGRNGTVVRIITVYRPVEPRRSSTKQAAAQQRKAFMEKFHRNDTPRQAILDDLAKEIHGWRNAGEKLIILMDCNGDLDKGAILNFTQQCQLKDIILTHHPHQDRQWTQRDGSRPIDAIFTTKDIDAVSAGYASLDQGVQAERVDHR